MGYKNRERKVTLLKKNRVWAQIQLDGISKPIRMQADLVPADTEVGQVISMYGHTEYMNQTRYGGICTFVPGEPEADKKADREADLNHWLKAFWNGYANGNGYYFKRAVEEIHKLGDHSHDAEIEAARRKIEARKWWSYFLEATTATPRPYFYDRAVRELHAVGCSEHDAEIEQWRRKLLSQNANKEEVETDTFRRLVFSYSRLFYPEVGSCVMKGGIPYEIVTCKFHKEDGLSFGASTDEWYECRCRDISGTDKGRQMIEEAAFEKLVAERKTKMAKLISEFQHRCMEHGHLNSRKIRISDISGEVILDTMNVYGSGYMIKADESANQVWYIVNNGGDGDNWAVNTIETWGAGAYGYVIDLDSVKDILDAYAELASA